MSVRVSLFATCLADQFFAEACADTVRLLRHLGAEVDVPTGQTCCGQPAHNSGRPEEARRMAFHTANVFRDADYIVLPSGSCAGMMRSFYHELLGDDSRDLVGRTYELSQFLVHVLRVSRLGSGLEGQSVAYHHGCHALRELRVEKEPVSLLEGCGARVVEWEAHQECCGFGGLFSAKLPEVSAAMADRKLDTLPKIDFVASADGGCLLQLSGRSEKRADATRFRHLASALWEGVGA